METIKQKGINNEHVGSGIDFLYFFLSDENFNPRILQRSRELLDFIQGNCHLLEII